MPAPTTARERAVHLVLEQVDRDRTDTVELLRQLVAIPSETGSDAEHEAQAFLAGWLERSGLEVDHWQLDLPALTAEADFPGCEAPRTEGWGLVGRLPGGGGGSTLMLNGHIDVVPPGDPTAWSTAPYAADLVTEAGRTWLRGRGACDMKGGLVAALIAARAASRCGVQLEGDLLLASVIGEEDGGLGTFATLRRGWRADACVVPEPTSLDLVPACAGALTFRLRVHGQAVHASRRMEGVSAVEKFLPVLAALRELERRRCAEVDPLVQRWVLPYPIEIGVIRAGDWASTVPDLLVAEGRLGVALDEPVTEARAALEEAVDGVNRSDPWLSRHPIEVEWWGGQFASGRLPEGDPLLTDVGDAHTASGTGPAQQVWAGPYGSDLRLLVGTGGIPTLHYGPGDAGLAHAPDERVALDEVFRAARTLAVLAVHQCGIR